MSSAESFTLGLMSPAPEGRRGPFDNRNPSFWQSGDPSRLDEGGREGSIRDSGASSKKEEEGDSGERAEPLREQNRGPLPAGS